MSEEKNPLEPSTPDSAHEPNSQADSASPELMPERNPELMEQDEPPMKRLGVMAVLFVVIVLAAVLGVAEFFKLKTAAEVEYKNSAPNPELLTYRERDRARLHEYERLDEANGVYRVPVDRAMELLLEHPERYMAGVRSPTDPVAPGEPEAPAQPGAPTPEAPTPGTPTPGAPTPEPGAPTP